MRIKTVTIGLVLAGTALASTALTLGRAKGAAWIGQPLDLRVPVQRDASDMGLGLCAEADVFHGESRQDGARVQIQTESGPTADTTNLKVTSSALVDEPVVTVYVRVGCGQKVTRKYVLLADFPPEPQIAPARPTPAAPQVPTVAPAAMPVDAQQAAVAVPVAPAVPPSPAPPPANADKSKADQPLAAVGTAPQNDQPKKKAIATPAKPKKPAVASAAPASAMGKPRLRLDPVETLTERIKNLEAATTQTSLQDELSRDAQKMQQLQSDLRTLLDQAVKNEATLAAMRERLERAEADRAPIALVYLLVALVALSLAALAYLWTRKAMPMQWTGGAQSASGTRLAQEAPDA